MSIFSRLRKTEEKTEAKKQTTKTGATSDATKTAAKEKTNTTGTTQQNRSPKNNLAHRVLLQPVITEKATLTGTYIFAVADATNKVEVKKAIYAVYGVTPASVRVMNVRGKAKVWSSRYGKQKDWKKAIVRLKKGETINVYQGT